jgi:hypothetical protein
MPDEAVAQPSRWRLPFTWLSLVALAWLLFELTHNLALGAIAVCLKFGWEDFLTARWLWRNDAHPWRRRSTVWLYVSWGLWKTAVVAFLMTFGFAVVAARQAIPAAPAMPVPLRAFLVTLLTTLAGFALSTLATVLTVLCAWYGGIRLWLDSAVHRARRAEVWPPALLCEGRPNRLSHLLLTALALSLFTTVMGLIALASQIVGGATLCLVLSFAAPVAGPVMMLLLRDLFLRKVGADSPFECWPEEWNDDEEAWREEHVT